MGYAPDILQQQSLAQIRPQNKLTHEIFVLITYAVSEGLDRISFFVNFELLAKLLILFDLLFNTPVNCYSHVEMVTLRILIYFHILIKKSNKDGLVHYKF